MTTPKSVTVRLEKVAISRLNIDSLALWSTTYIPTAELKLSAASIPLVDEATMEVKSNIGRVISAAFDNEETILVAMMPAVTTASELIIDCNPARFIGGTISVEEVPVQLLNTKDRTLEQRATSAAANRYVQENREFLRAEINSVYEG